MSCKIGTIRTRDLRLRILLAFVHASIFILFYIFIFNVSRLGSSFRSIYRPVLHAAARVVQEMGKSRAAAYSLGLYDIDEGTQLHTYSESVDSIDLDINESSKSEGISQ